MYLRIDLINYSIRNLKQLEAASLFCYYDCDSLCLKDILKAIDDFKNKQQMCMK